MNDKQTIINTLKESVCEIRFTKVDGTDRTMNCTLRPDLLPPPKETKEGEVKKSRGLTDSKDHVVVWDLDKGAWRSFRIDSLKEINSSSPSPHTN